MGRRPGWCSPRSRRHGSVAGTPPPARLPVAYGIRALRRGVYWPMAEQAQVRERVVMPPGGHWAAEIEAGERLRIVEVEGEQVCDLLSFHRAEPRDQLSE